MKRDVRVLTAAGSLLLALSGADAAVAQKQGGILRSPFFRQPGEYVHARRIDLCGQPADGSV